jgi:hypothetical protein
MMMFEETLDVMHGLHSKTGIELHSKAPSFGRV